MALHNTPNSSESNVVQYRIERGAAAQGTDGLLGTVEQIVVDRDTGELRALIVRSADGGSEFELPAEHVQRATGDQVFLDIGRADMARRPELATPYDPAQYVPVYHGETAAPDEATKTAIDTERPVVTEVEENAAEVVAPQPEEQPVNEETTPMASATTPTDTATGAATTWTPRDAAAVGNSDGAAVGDEVTEPRRQATFKTESTMPSTTGTLIGGKPSTSGMGEKASVPRSDEPPYDVTTTPPGTQYTPPASGMVEAFREAGSEPGASDLENIDTQPVGTPPDALDAEDLTPTMPLRRAGNTGSMRADTPTADVSPVSATLPETEFHIERAPLSEMLPAPVLISAGVLAAGAIGGILLRRRAQNTNQVKSRARAAKGALGDLLGNAGDSAADASDKARAAAKTTKRKANRAARRGSWFLRGILAGAAAAVLYAPDSGEHLRLQLNSAANRLLRRAS